MSSGQVLAQSGFLGLDDQGRILPEDVFAFEPHPDNPARILAMLAATGLSNVDLRDYAVGRRSESLEFVYPGDLGRGSADRQIKSRLLQESHAQHLTIEVRALDAEIAEGRLPDPDFVKVDVEGLEFDVLDGMSDTARRCKPGLFVELHGADTAQEAANYRRVLGWLLERGYRVTHVESGRALRGAENVDGLYAGQHLHCT